MALNVAFSGSPNSDGWVNMNNDLFCLYCVLFRVVRKPADLQDLAPGTNPPFVTFNGEVKVDVNKIEEFLEEKLTPPR